MKDIRLQIRMDESTIVDLDNLVLDKGYKSRSDAIRNVIHEKATASCGSFWHIDYNGPITCDACKEPAWWANGISFILPKFCPNCGRRMANGGKNMVEDKS